MTSPVPLRVFYPTRFHIFDQLAAPAFAAEGYRLEIYSVYPPRYFRSRRYAALRPYNRTLWLGLFLRALMRLAGKASASGSLAQALRSLYIAGCAAEFRLRVRRARPGVVMASAGYLGHHLAELQRAGHRVVTNHGSLYEPSVRAWMQANTEDAAEDGGNWSNPWLMTRMDFEFFRADAIVVCSPCARDSFPEGLQARIHVVPLGAPDAAQHASRAIPRKKFTFLHISNLSFLKNTARVLDAFAAIRGPDDKLLIGGPPPRDPALRRRLVEPDPGVRWLGRLDQAGVAEAMAAADIFVHPSFADGWGMVITEALAAGLPVVASPFTGAASYYAGVSDKGTASVLLADPLDTEAIIGAMARLRDTLKADPGFAPVVPMSWAASAALLAATLAPLRKP